MTDKTPDVCQCHEKHAPTYWKGIVREYKDALEKAGKERDEALFRAERAHENVWAREEIINRLNARARKGERERDDARATVEEQAALIEHLRADASRPLAPDAITDEMIERGRSAYWGPTFGGSVVGRVRAILAAALTEPPKRPEGAEDIERLIRDAENEGQGADNEALANYLAARLVDPTRKED